MAVLRSVEPREASATLLSKARAASVGHRADCAERQKWSLRGGLRAVRGQEWAEAAEIRR